MTPAVWVAISSALIALLSLSYTIYDKRRSLSKKLGWILTSDTDLMQGGPANQWADLEVNWKGQKLQHPRLMLLEVLNTGRVELEADKIHVLPTLTLSDCKIISAEIYYRPAGSKVQKVLDAADVTENSIEAPAFTLNPKDKLVFRLLIDGGTKKPEFAMAASGFKVSEEETVSSSADYFEGNMLIRLTSSIGAIALTGAVAALINVFSN